MMRKIGAWLRPMLAEPVTHFLLAGLVVYALLAGRAPDLGERRILVNRSVVTALVQRWQDSFHYPPSQSEIDGLIRDYVADQVYYREALRLGLDKDDEVVVRRMRRKLEQAAASEAETRTPADRELQALIDKDPARYAAEPRLSFEQIYLGADSPATRATAAQGLDRLARGEVVAGLPAPLERAFAGLDSGTIAGAGRVRSFPGWGCIWCGSLRGLRRSSPSWSRCANGSRTTGVLLRCARPRPPTMPG